MKEACSRSLPQYVAIIQYDTMIVSLSCNMRLKANISQLNLRCGTKKRKVKKERKLKNKKNMARNHGNSPEVHRVSPEEGGRDCGQGQF